MTCDCEMEAAAYAAEAEAEALHSYAQELAELVGYLWGFFDGGTLQADSFVEDAVGRTWNLIFDKIENDMGLHPTGNVWGDSIRDSAAGEYIWEGC